MWLPILASLVDARFHAIPQNIPLELRKHGQHSGQRPPARGREVEGFAQGDEADLKGGQLLQRVNQVRQRPPPAIQPPDQDAIDLSPAGRFNEHLPLGPGRGSGRHVFDQTDFLYQP